MRFSKRYGYKQIRDIIQIDSMDEPLRNGLWSLLKVHVWDNARWTSEAYHGGYYLSDNANKELRFLSQRLWFNYFKKPLDRIDDNWEKVLEFLRGYFFGGEWYEVYDFIEFIACNYERYRFPETFISECNRLFEKEVSAYRFVDQMITRITEEEQIEEIELALKERQGSVRTHLRRALELLSSKDSPDYRNSIKESILGVEAIVAQSVGAKKGTLGQLIKKLEDEIGLHPALRTAFSSLYGYTNDEGGIRHAILEQKELRFEDAKFFLVVCSAFANYVSLKMLKDA